MIRISRISYSGNDTYVTLEDDAPPTRTKMVIHLHGAYEVELHTLGSVPQLEVKPSKDAAQF